MDNADAHHNLGLILKNQGKLEEAKAKYKQAIRLAPNYAIAHTNLGNVLLDQGKLEEAKAEYQQAIRLDPNFAIREIVSLEPTSSSPTDEVHMK